METIEGVVPSPQKRREEWERPMREQYHSPDDLDEEEECCPRDFDEYPHYSSLRLWG